MMQRLHDSYYVQTSTAEGIGVGLSVAMQATQLALAADYLEHSDLKACCKILEALTEFSPEQNWYAIFMHETFNWWTKAMCNKRTFIIACEWLLSERPTVAAAEIDNLLRGKNCAPGGRVLELFGDLSNVLSSWCRLAHVTQARLAISDWMRVVRLSFGDDIGPDISGPRGSTVIAPILEYGDGGSLWGIPGRDGKTPGGASVPMCG